ncbi:hypothetical protein JCM10450v2_005434 [Rhodotorula kratochvilovae]
MDSIPCVSLHRLFRPTARTILSQPRVKAHNRPQLIGPADKGAIDAFLAKYKPSSNDSSLGPWIWVRIPGKGEDEEGAKVAEELTEEELADLKFSDEGAVLVDKMMDRLEEIKETAPVRANKSKGLRSQKDLREETHADFHAKVKALAQKHKILTGKWLFYPAPENVDFVWSKLVHAIAEADGVLAKTGAVHCAKVATVLKGDGERSSYVVCVYVDDSWDEKAVGDAFKVLVKDLSMTSQAYKPDALTLLGIDSKHPSGIKVSLYGKTTFMTKEELDAALEANASKGAAGKKVKERTLDDEVATGAADGFDPVSDSEDDQPKKKKAKTSKK